MEFLLNLRRLMHGLYSALSDPLVRPLLAITFSLVLASSLFFRLVEGWSLLDGIYFSVITLATVGYGDLTPKTAAGKIFTMIYVLCGIGIFVATAAAVADHLLRHPKDDNNKP